jgi:hypothetical protein
MQSDGGPVVSVSARHTQLGHIANEAFADGIKAGGAYLVVEAARRWVDAIQDHPNLWAGDEDFALIKAVEDERANYGQPRKWTQDPDQESR